MKIAHEQKAMAFWSVAHRCRQSHLKGSTALSTLVYQIGKAVTGSDIHPDAVLHNTVSIPHPTGVVIGDSATIGARTIIYSGVVIGLVDPNKRLFRKKEHADVGSDVILGAGAKIIGAVRIGNGARVGANAVVLEDVAPNTTVVGVPACPVSRRVAGHGVGVGSTVDSSIG